MFNPFVRFEPRFIEALRKMNDRYLVSQTYTQAYDHFADERKEYLLFSQYGALAQANIHLSAIKNDRYAAILDLEKEVHRNRLLEMLKPDSQYIIHITIPESNEKLAKRINEKFSKNIRRYIAKYTNWKIASDKTIFPKFEVTFGEFFLLLKYGNEKIRVSLSDIEKA